MLDVFVRLAPSADDAGTVAEVIRWTPDGGDPVAPRHQVVTLYGEASVRHLAWAIAAVTRGGVDERPWRVRADGSAETDGAALGPTQVAADAEFLLSAHEAPLRRVVAELTRQGFGAAGRGIRLPLDFTLDGAPDIDRLLAGQREADGYDVDEPTEGELAA